MHTRANRKMIHACLAEGQSAALLMAALSHGAAAQWDCDVLRAVMQRALEQGDIDTVANAARRMIDVGLAFGQLLVCVEGLCLLRNVAGDADAEITRVLDALDLRGFDSARVDVYAAWTPDVATLDLPADDCPDAADVLIQLSQEPLPTDAPAFAWATVWPQLDRTTRRLLIDNVHFELRQSDEVVLVPPRLSAGWITSGELLTTTGETQLVYPGTMLAPLDDVDIIAGVHVRIVGLRQERWEFMLNQPSFAMAWQQVHVRAQAFLAMRLLSERVDLADEIIETLLGKATLMHPGSSSGGDTQHRVFLVIDGFVSVPNAELDAASYGPGSLLSLPAGRSLDQFAARVLRWSATNFEQMIPLALLAPVEL